MKNKIFISAALVLSLAVAGSAAAAGQGSNVGTAGQQQTATVQVQTVNAVRAQDRTATQAGTQVRQQDQQRLQDGSEAGGQMQNQNQVQTAAQSSSQNQPANSISAQRRSQVANAVQSLLQVADRNGGIGEQVRIIAQNQTQNQEKAEVGLERAQSRSGIVKFLIGPDYGEINSASKILEQNREQLRILNEIKNQLSNQGDQLQLNEQIRILEQANADIEVSLGSAERGFSLLGWMFKLFAK